MSLEKTSLRSIAQNEFDYCGSWQLFQSNTPFLKTARNKSNALGVGTHAYRNNKQCNAL
jgi:hypothetical protein